MPDESSALPPAVPDAVLAAEFDRLLDFGRRFPHPLGGAAWLDDHGEPDLTRPLHTWISARMAHVYSAAALLGVDGAAELTDRALSGLTGPLRDTSSGGWFSSVLDAGSAETHLQRQSPDEKSCYAHAFVVLAASSAAVAGRPGARALFDQALAEWIQHFWDADAEMFVDSWDRSFSTLSPYRGVNANMHAVEALLAAGDVTGDPEWHGRALAIAHRVVINAERQQWRIPEHYTPDWAPVLEHNRDHPDDPFQPYGATVGHAYEWSRLLLHLRAALTDPPPWLAAAAVELFQRGVTDGWAVDGAPGFVYTTDWTGVPVVRDRMHWVAAEAVAAAAALQAVTEDEQYGELARRWWGWIDAALIDRAQGSWHHQLDPGNRPTDTVWPGKPDLYHAVQATLLPRVPLAPSLASALSRGLLAG